MTTICRALEVSRSNLYEQQNEVKKIMGKKVNLEEDARIIAIIKDVIAERQSYGYRRVTARLRFLGEKINPKRVYRLMKQNSLLLQKYGAKPSRSHTGKIETIASNIRWCSDGFGIQCFNGEQLQVAFSLDCHDREIMSWVTSSKGLDAELIRDLMTDTIEERFGQVDVLPHPVQWLSDNGKMYTAHETVRYGGSRGLEIRTTPAYSPESNGMAEAFVKTFKRDYVWLADLASAAKVLEQLPGWFEDYNENAPHKALKMKSPRQYRRETLTRAI